MLKCKKVKVLYNYFFLEIKSGVLELLKFINIWESLMENIVIVCCLIEKVMCNLKILIFELVLLFFERY